MASLRSAPRTTGSALFARIGRMPWQSSTSSTSCAPITALLALFALLLAAPACAQSFPAFTGLVTDAANVLPADRKAALETKLEAFQKQTGRQLVVATIPDLQGIAIEDYGYRLGRTWGVGLKGADNGAILIVAPKDRKVRIEVGYKLEPVLTDGYSSVVIQQKIIPAFKSGDIPGGVEAGADALIRQLGLPDEQAKAEMAKAAAAFDKSHQGRKGHSGSGFPFGLLVWLFIAGFVVLARLRNRGARWHGQSYGSGSGGGGNWPIWLWAASEIADSHRGSGAFGGGFDSGSSGSGGGSDGSWGGGGFTGGGGGGFGGGGASGSW